jgi:hypothetical protein
MDLAEAEGLDVEREIRAVEAQRLGETVPVWDAAQQIALAVCHYGKRGRRRCVLYQVRRGKIGKKLRRVVGCVRGLSRVKKP